MPEIRPCHYFPGPDALAEIVARRWLDAVAAAQGATFTVALSGGRITSKFFASLVAQNQTRGVSFANVHFFWADERCLPPTDKESNYRLADELLFGPLKISPAQIHRLKGEADPESAAREASAELSRIAPAGPSGQPVLDLVFLGMGEDGHVASLFPGAGPEVLNCIRPFLAIYNSAKPPPTRISLSYAALAAAKNIWVLASGAGKEQALRDSLAAANKTPLGRVIAASAGIEIFSDIKISG